MSQFLNCPNRSITLKGFHHSANTQIHMSLIHVIHLDTVLSEEADYMVNQLLQDERRVSWARLLICSGTYFHLCFPESQLLQLLSWSFALASCYGCFLLALCFTAFILPKNITGTNLNLCSIEIKPLIRSGMSLIAWMEKPNIFFWMKQN